MEKANIKNWIIFPTLDIYFIYLYVSGSCGGQKRVSDALGLEPVVSYHVDTGS